MGKRSWAISLTFILMTGCSTLAGPVLGLLAGPAGDGISADAEVTVGKKEEAVNVDTQLGDNNKQTASVINNTQRIPTSWLILIVLLAGWAIPDPQTMGRGLLSFLKILMPWK